MAHSDLYAREKIWYLVKIAGTFLCRLTAQEYREQALNPIHHRSLLITTLPILTAVEITDWGLHVKILFISFLNVEILFLHFHY